MLDSNPSSNRLDGSGIPNLKVVKYMQYKMIIALLLGLLTLLPTTNVWSCSALGPNKHMGFLLDINESSKSFIIHDAESDSPITFQADDTILD